MKEEFRDYLDTEIKAIIHDVERICSPESPDFNKTALDWVKSNAADFRERWNKLHGPSEVIG